MAQTTKSGNSPTVSDETITVYPNPMQEKSTVSFVAKLDGSTHINAYSVDGKKIISVTEKLERGKNSFELSLPKGTFVIQINGNGFSYSTKVISQTNGKIQPKLVFIGADNTQVDINVGNLNGNVIMRASASVAPPTVVTNSMSMISYNLAVCGGTVYSDGGAPVTDRGYYWSRNPIPTTSDNKVVCGSGIGNCNCTMYGLISNAIYYVRAYATNSQGTTLAPNITSFTTTALSVGNSYDGGIVAYIYKPEDLGYVSGMISGILVSPSNIGQAVWYNNANYAITGQSATGLGDSGLSNTTTICGKQGTGNYAASLCLYTSLPQNGFAWYLPSRDELYLFYQNRAAIGGFSNAKYWSSSEDTTSPAYYAWCQDFSNGGTTTDLKSNNYLIRAARKFVMTPGCPIVNTTGISSVTSTHCLSTGNIQSDGGASITASGVCWSTSPNPTTANSKTIDGSTTGSYTSFITGLSYPNVYYVRAYATNFQGTSYGNQLSFQTVPTASPTLTTTTASSITSNSAISGGNISNDGGATVTERGILWSTSSTLAINSWNKIQNGSGTGSFINTITGLSPGKTYYVCSYAINGTGTAFGNVISFTTDVILPTILTTDVTLIRFNSATSGGSISSDGGGAVTERGICWIENKPNTLTPVLPTIENSALKKDDHVGTGSFSLSMSNLYYPKYYYVRAYAKNSKGVSYGPVVVFYTNAGVGDIYNGGIVGYVSGYDDNNVSHGIIVATASDMPATWDGAKNACTNYNFQYTDWKLPSIDELLKIYSNNAISKVFSAPNSYWSSSEASSINGGVVDEARVLNSDGTTKLVIKTDTNIYFKAIRYF